MDESLKITTFMLFSIVSGIGSSEIAESIEQRLGNGKYHVEWQHDGR